MREKCVSGGWNWCFFQVLIEDVGWEERVRLYSLSMLRSNSDFGDVVTRCVHMLCVLTTNDGHGKETMKKQVGESGVDDLRSGRQLTPPRT